MTPTLVPQFDGSALASKNCFAAEGAMLVATETAGQKHPTAAEFRLNVRNLDANGKPTTPDLSGGGRPAQIVETAQRAYGVTLDLRIMPFEDAWSLSNRSDVMLGFSISYAPVSGGPYDASPGFTGLHGICRSGGLVYDPLADGRRAGIPKGPQKWPKALLRRAAGKYADTGEGRATVIVAYAPAQKPTRYSVLFEPGAIFEYRRDPQGWTRVRDDGVSKKSSAPCEPPFTIPWAGGQKRLVRITAGMYAGSCVEPTATHLALVSK